jgi:uncharacterized membrane protein YhhN
MLFIILMAFQMPATANSTTYKYLIIIGLVFSLAGDIFLMLPTDHFIAGLLSFLIAHIFYIVAFILTGAKLVSALYAIPFLLYGIVLFSVLLPYLKEMKIPVAVYASILLLMSWTAFSRWMVSFPAKSLIAFIGSLSFMASDSILALDRFRNKMTYGQASLMITYFLAQWLIAFSIY